MSLHTMSVLVEDKPGVLTRVAGLFAARGFNIDSLAVGPTDDVGLSRMTIVVQVDTKTLEQVTKQLNKLVNVIKILEHEPGDAVERELMLVKVKGEGEARARILEICDVFRVRVLDVTHRTITIEGTGTPDKLGGPARAAARLRDRGALAHRADRARPWGPRDQGTGRAAADGRRQRTGVDRRRRLTARDGNGTGKAGHHRWRRSTTTRMPIRRSSRGSGSRSWGSGARVMRTRRT